MGQVFVKKVLLGLIMTMVMSAAFSMGVYTTVASDFVKTSFEDVIKTISSQVSNGEDNVSTLIKTKFVKSIIDSEKITKYVFKDIDLSNHDEMILGAYLSDKIINDYLIMITSYKKYDKLYMKVNKIIIKKKNMTGEVYVTIGEKSGSSVDLIFKVSRLKTYPRIYDVVVGGVSLVKTYKAIIKSKYRRKGDEYIKKIVSEYVG